jgi:hypothetical protein
MPTYKEQNCLLMASFFRTLSVCLLSASLLAPLLLTHNAHAQAFCALRQPHRAQQRLFPESTSLETFTDEVTAEHRAEVKQELNFTLHQAELGLHTLYAVFKGEGAAKEHIGYLHVRSEEGEWGLIEITWALTPDLKVRDFIFQRCREAARKEVQTPAFKNVLQNKEREALRALLTADGGALSAPVKDLSDEAQPLAYRLIRSALKTIAVTRAVWHPVVIKP